MLFYSMITCVSSQVTLPTPQVRSLTSFTCHDSMWAVGGGHSAAVACFCRVQFVQRLSELEGHQTWWTQTGLCVCVFWWVMKTTFDGSWRPPLTTCFIYLFLSWKTFWRWAFRTSSTMPVKRFQARGPHRPWSIVSTCPATPPTGMSGTTWPESATTTALTVFLLTVRIVSLAVHPKLSAPHFHQPQSWHLFMFCFWSKPADVDECQSMEAQCVPPAQCTNTYGGYRCLCNGTDMDESQSCVLGEAQHTGHNHGWLQCLKKTLTHLSEQHQTGKPRLDLILGLVLGLGIPLLLLLLLALLACCYCCCKKKKTTEEWVPPPHTNTHTHTIECCRISIRYCETKYHVISMYGYFRFKTHFSRFWKSLEKIDNREDLDPGLSDLCPIFYEIFFFLNYNFFLALWCPRAANPPVTLTRSQDNRTSVFFVWAGSSSGPRWGQGSSSITTKYMMVLQPVAGQ